MEYGITGLMEIAATSGRIAYLFRANIRYWYHWGDNDDVRDASINTTASVSPMIASVSGVHAKTIRSNGLPIVPLTMDSRPWGHACAEGKILLMLVIVST